MSQSPTDHRDAAYQDLKESAEDWTLRRQVAARLHDEPMTTAELTQRFPERSKNAIRPRVNELHRMDCVTVHGERENPSGSRATVWALTRLGERLVTTGEEPGERPTTSELKHDVIRKARAVAVLDEGRDELRRALERLDRHLD